MLTCSYINNSILCLAIQIQTFSIGIQGNIIEPTKYSYITYPINRKKNKTISYKPNSNCIAKPPSIFKMSLEKKM